ncbi:MAG: efflux RND transporter periplasmic adaptor subunit [Sphingomonas sp.]
MADANASNLDDFLGVKPRPAWRRYLKWGAIALGVVLLLLVAQRFFSGGAKPEYATAPVERGNLTVTVSATGKLAPTNQVTVGSELSGLVTKVLVDVNDHVTKGQPLAIVDPSRFRDAVNQSQAALNANVAAVAQARATLAQSKATLARYEAVSKLSGGRVPAKTEMDQAIADAARAAANLRAAEANVGSAQAALSSNVTQLKKAVIYSPVNGVVLARQIEPGQTVAASFNTPTLFVIAEDLSKMKLEVQIDEADVGDVREGQQASFTVDAFPGAQFPAQITRVDLGSNLSAQNASSTTSSTTSQQVVSYGATLSVENPNLQLRPGMTATAEITTISKNNVVLVPNAAFRFKPTDTSQGGGIASAFGPPRLRRDQVRGAKVGRRAQQQLYIQQDDGTLKQLTVTTGDTNGTMTEVLSGEVKPGMKVVTGELAKDKGGKRSGGGSGGGQRRGG